MGPRPGSLVGGLQPVAPGGLSSQALDGLLRFAQAVLDAHSSLVGPLALVEWVHRLRAVLEQLVRPAPNERMEWLRLRSRLQALERVEVREPVSLVVFRAAVRELLSEPGGPPAQQTGAISFCPLISLGGVPHRVVVLLGMDDGRLPRPHQPPAFDLGAGAPRPGEHGPTEVDRHALLSAILAARERLILLYTGRSDRNNEAQPPAVPVGELLDVVCESIRPPEGGAEEVRAGLVIEHPLQPFSPRSFAPLARVPSWDREWLGAARVLVGADRSPHVPLFPRPVRIPGGHRPVLSVAQLMRWCDGPVDYLLQQRLGVDLRPSPVDLPLPSAVQPSAAQRRHLAQRVLDLELDGLGEDCVQRLAGAGLLPPGTLGQVWIEDLRGRVLELLAAVRRARRGERLPAAPVRVDIGPVRLSGWISGLYPGGRVRQQAAPVRATQLLRLWVKHQLLQHVHPGWDSRLVAPAPGGGVVEHRLRGGGDFVAALELLLRLLRFSLEVPAPFAPETSLAWYRSLGGARELGTAPSGRIARASRAARRAWRDRYSRRGEWYRSAALQRVFGDVEPFATGCEDLHGLRQVDQRNFHRFASALWRRVDADLDGGLP